ncbi:MAG: cellulose biosynthesis protein BcsS [Methylocystis sp.]|uniref:cellulose biosynthesis protein BcsS n=1 Tax=Methylocystis sp. TaxID=1911079 RepID=UPI003D0FA481
MSPNAVDVSSLAEAEGPTSAIDQPLKRPPSVSFDSWSWGTSRRSWYQWFTATAATGSSLDESGWRLRATGGFGGYADNVKGSDAENLVANALDVDDATLPYLGTVGKYYGADGFVGAQIGYALIEDNWEASGFVGVGMTREGYLGANMASPALRIPPDAARDLAGTEFGVLGSLEFRATPTSQLMLFASGIYTTAYQWGYFEVKPGVSVPFDDALPVLLQGKLFVGPHAALNTYRGDLQPMFGAHITIMEIGPFYASLSGGYVRDEYAGKGAYSILETSVRF